MVLKTEPAEGCGKRCGFGCLLACVLVFGAGARNGASAQGAAESGAEANTGATALGTPASPQASTDSLGAWEGLPVRHISFEGVAADRLTPLPDHLSQRVGAPLRAARVQGSLRQIYATGLFETVQAEGWRDQDGVSLVFRGQPRIFIGTVSVDGAKGASVNAQLERASQLAPGTRFTQARLSRALDRMRQALAENGFNEPVITPSMTPHLEEQLEDIAFHVVSGPQTRVGAVQISGDPGMSLDDFRHYAHLRSGSRIDHETGNRALDGVLRHFQKEKRLEAEVKIESQTYTAGANRTNYVFTANRGPVVNVLVEGANLSALRIKHVIPIFEEGTVDDDLLNEGNRRLRDYYQRLGYFDVKVEHEKQDANADQVVILYKVTLGPRRHVGKVSVAGNRYFDAATLGELLGVHAADTLDRHGLYSQALVAADVSALENVYQSNGFSKVKVTPEIDSPDAGGTEKTARARSSAPLNVVYRIEEGEQMRVGVVRLEGNDHVDAQKLLLLMNTSAGQLFSPRNLAEDRDALLTDYLSRGFDQVQVEVTPTFDTGTPGRVDVLFKIAEGQQIFVRKVLLTGLHFTRPDTIAKAITLHPGDPLNQTALFETQRNLYEFALFNEIDTAVENPLGAETLKTVLVQATEARRWVFTYGAGFEAQTGTPQNNCAGIIASGAKCTPNGKTGVSPRFLGDLTRNNLFGREESASLRGTYGLLEQKVDLLFQNPHFYGNRDFGLTISGGYANSQDVTTYVASKLEAGMRWSEHFSRPGSFFSKANTFVYEFDFRRVKVAESSLQVFPNEIPLLSTAVRVTGPGVTWIRDTRDSPLDAHRGTYTSFQEFLSHGEFGAQAEFNRLDLSNSSYYSFDKGRFVLARNTRYGQERAFGDGGDELIPLPERLYAGGPTSLRGFSINAAGPRDPQTGFPIGGAGALINSTEMRLPPPTLPWVGDAISFVLFHDMGNVFTNASDAWVSALRVRQPDRESCTNPQKVTSPPSDPTGPNTSTGMQGPCSFNYFSHTPGVGLRYHTPVGPIRLDFSYNLNPPIFPVTYNYSNPTETPHVGEASHFNFFFSLGQTF
jgi:outer membrane protein assembly complex protein YaeT